jgi:hypothetical protein
MATTTNYGWDTPDDTDLVKDGAAAIRTLGSSIDTTTKNLNPQTTTGALAYRSATANVNTALPIGTAGQILAVSGGVPAWINNDQGDITEVQAGTGISVASGTGPIPVVTNTVATEFDAKGDLVVGTGSDTFDRLAVGTNTYILTADSAEATGLKWAAPAAGGKVLQVIQDTDSTFRSNATTTYQTTGLSQAITPSSASSKILIMAAVTYRVTDEATTNNISFRIRRGSTTIIEDTYVAQKANSVYLGTRYTQIYLDSPSTTSSTTYELQFMNPNGTANALVQAGGADNQAVMILMEIGA